MVGCEMISSWKERKQRFQYIYYQVKFWWRLQKSWDTIPKMLQGEWYEMWGINSLWWEGIHKRQAHKLSLEGLEASLRLILGQPVLFSDKNSIIKLLKKTLLTPFPPSPPLIYFFKIGQFLLLSDRRKDIR